MGSNSDDIVIEPAGEAMKMAQKWMNQKGLRADMAAQAAADAEQDKPRPQGLGLGAAFLPHHKGKLITAGLDKHLMKSIRAGAQGPAPCVQQPCADCASSSDEDDVGRAGAFAARPTGQVAIPQQKVSIQPSVGVKKDRKRVKTKASPLAKQ